MKNVDLSCLKGVFSGGDSLSVELKNKFDEFLLSHNSTVGVKQGELRQLARRSNRVPAVEITPEEIEEVEGILIADELNNDLRGEKYLFYSRKRLDELMEDMIDSFMNDYVYKGKQNA